MVRITETVWLVAASCWASVAFLACSQPTKSPSTGSAAASEHPAPLPAPAASATSEPVASAAPSPLSSSSGAQTSPPPQRRDTGSAYFGCGEPIPVASLWDESTEDEVFNAIGAAKACARAERRKVLLEFVAPWCADCREMAKLDETPVVSETLRARFERVRVNVGKWDRHEALRESFGVKALATYIIIDPTTSKQLAKTTLEPITRRGPKLTADDWARWLNKH